MTALGERSTLESAMALASRSTHSEESMEADVPNIETESYRRSLPRWEKCRDLMHGTEAIRARGTAYLPMHPQESLARYDARRTIAALFNGYARTVVASVGLLLQSEPTLADDMPQELVDMWENVDGCGMHGAVFTHKLAVAGTVDGFAGIISEYPRANDPRIDRSKASYAATIALATGAPLDGSDENALGLRPYFILVKADQVLPIYESVNGRRTLVLLVVRETTRERKVKSRFGFKSVTRHRVYSLEGGQVRYERWTEVDGRATRDEGPTVMRNLTGIPWSPFAPGEELEPGEYKPVLMDLAELNITHHRINTGILSLQDLACIPTPVRVGCPPSTNAAGVSEYPPLLLGPGNTIEVPGTVGVPNPVYWLTPDISVLEPAQKSLENIKAEMGAMGAAFLVPQVRAETAEAHRIDATAERADISTLGRALTDCLESAFAFAGQYRKIKAGSISVNKDYEKLTMDAQMITAWGALVDTGFDEVEATMAFQRAGLLSPDADPKELAEKWRNNRAAKQAADAQMQADKLADREAELEAQRTAA